MQILVPRFRFDALQQANVRFSAQEPVAPQPDRKKASKVPGALEWLETGGEGSYAGSTVGGAHTRRYHGLLVASGFPPVDRRVRLSRMDETVVTPDGEKFNLFKRVFPLTDNREVETPSPLLEKFTVLPVPTWEYTLPEGQGTLKKQLAMRKDQATVVTGYTLSADAKSPIFLKIRPFVNERGFHDVSQGTWPWTQEKESQGLVLKSGGVNPQYFQWRSSRPEGPVVAYNADGHWYNNFRYIRESDRGLSDHENNFTPGELVVTLRPGETVNITASTRTLPEGGFEVDKIAADKDTAITKLIEATDLPDTETNRLLVRAADQFIVHRQSVNGPTVIAGYHWFNDWGRDTMIALPGLTLPTQRFEEAKGILTTFAKYAKNGLLPNNFPDSAGANPGYNTVDASLWWFQALDSYRKAVKSNASVDKAKNFTFLKGQFQELQKVIHHHIYGRHSGSELIKGNQALAGFLSPSQERLPVGDGHRGIGMEADGLIAADDPQLTWMDAADGGWVFTPRAGKAVEINALWYNGLLTMADLARDLRAYEQQHNPDQLFDDELQKRLLHYDKEIVRNELLADIVKAGMQKFWNAEGQYLNDLVDSPYEKDRETQIRPNQVFALSLPYRAFDKRQEAAVLKNVEKHLLTPYGLRSLAPGDKQYSPYYPNADRWERDKVYHQGAVWSWLIGPYIDALFNVKGDTPAVREEAKAALKPLLEHLGGKVQEHIQSGAVLGGIAEIFDGQAPHYAKGTVNQAWSVSEVLRQMVRLNA